MDLEGRDGAPRRPLEGRVPQALNSAYALVAKAPPQCQNTAPALRA